METTSTEVKQPTEIEPSKETTSIEETNNNEMMKLLVEIILNVMKVLQVKILS